MHNIKNSFEFVFLQVVCAFCMRRFWSAEDLRRHMRTHTGERPFSCDLCKRRFTLKHSMLRHRKKHEKDELEAALLAATSGEEDAGGSSQPSAVTPRIQHPRASLPSTSVGSYERMSLPTAAAVATGDAGAAPNGLVRNSFGRRLTSLTPNLASAHQAGAPQQAAQPQQSAQPRPNGADNDNDLISNLLGIQDRSIIDKVLNLGTVSADDAAKLLGMNNNNGE